MDGQRRAPAWMATVAIIALGLPIALGLLGAGVYAVLYSTNGTGTAALLTVGSLALFVVVYHDRIRSMEFGGAKMQFARKIKDRLKEAFELRLAGDYEQAQAKLEFAFEQFAHESDKRSKKYKIAEDYQEDVRANLEKIAKGDDFKGRVRKTASGLSLLPLIDLVMDFDGPSLLKVLEHHDPPVALCQELTDHLENYERQLRTGVIVRPGQKLNTEKLVRKLREEFNDGPLDLTCLLLIQNCKGTKTGKKFRDLAIQNGMHATNLEWEPSTGQEKLQQSLLEAILTVCNHGPMLSLRPHNGQVASNADVRPSANEN
jgi:hypothetical protein